MLRRHVLGRAHNLRLHARRGPLHLSLFTTRMGRLLVEVLVCEERPGGVIIGGLMNGMKEIWRAGYRGRRIVGQRFAQMDGVRPNVKVETQVVRLICKLYCGPLAVCAYAVSRQQQHHSTRRRLCVQFCEFINNHQNSGGEEVPNMSTTESATHRALAVPELLEAILLRLDGDKFKP